MLELKKEHPYLICIDSDGTIMNTMTIKHENCFGPCFLEVFQIQHHQNEILKYWLDLNLYKRTRGVNRFVGLDMIIEHIKKYGYSYAGSDEYHAWVIHTNEYSVASIRQQMEHAQNPSTFSLALRWSKRVNEEIARLPDSLAFPGVKEILEDITKYTDLMGVSSANPQAVYEEWNRLDLMKYFKFVGCQDKGNKISLLQQAIKAGYSEHHILMLGDAIGDLEAASVNKIKFYPIIPRYEVESWQRFQKEAIKKLLEGSYDECYQASLIQEFYKVLEEGV